MKRLLNKKWCGIRISYFLIILLLALIGIIVGSFYDQDISKALYDKNSGFGQFYETFGTGLGYMMIPASTMMLFLALYQNKNKWLRILVYCLFFVSLLASTYIYGHSLCPNQEYGLTTDTFSAYTFSFFLMALSSLLTFLFVDKKDKRGLLIVGSIVLLSMIIQLALINFLLKYIAMRPRYRFLMGDGNSEALEGVNETFHAWWEMKPFSHTSGDYYKSWPSGHTSTAAIALTLGLFPQVAEKKYKYEELIFFVVGFFHLLLTAFARIVAGAHFLTDVSFATFFSVLGILLSLYLVDLTSRKFPAEHLENAK